MSFIACSTHKTGVGNSWITMPIVCTNTIRNLVGSLSHFLGSPILPFLEVRALGLSKTSGPMGRRSVLGRSWAHIGRDMVGSRGTGDVGGSSDPVKNFIVDVVLNMFIVVVIVVSIWNVIVDVVMNEFNVVVIVVNIVMDQLIVVVIVVRRWSEAQRGGC